MAGRRNVSRNKFMNGLLISGSILPQEMLIEIFCRMDSKTLLKCQLSCKIWNELIKSVVWRRKAEVVFKQKFPGRDNVSWRVYFLMNKMEFDRNLVKNHSGALAYKYWKRFDSGSFQPRRINNMAIPALPDDPVSEGKNYCFIYGYNLNGCKSQTIELPKAGYSTKFMDVIQPRIEVSVWCRCRRYSYYNLIVRLGNEKDWLKILFKYDSSAKKHPEDGQWHKITHVFENYGPGISRILIEDRGFNKSTSSRTSVKILTPNPLPLNFDEAFM